ncbi:hypothetical protein EKG38_07970 [Shewanella canadensis]|uniref:IPT/TIG domain-containing protein n=1 Tax=Shewanella canadensis TaxID=271096 RepID=A0A431WWC0_9GAMM|nr:IPT/TIG domain-containing protein [Shewanella canadensis]RTR39725.1 hypothetical protein EKG38_07970 [Shewanella canadensis]
MSRFKSTYYPLSFLLTLLIFMSSVSFANASAKNELAIKSIAVNYDKEEIGISGVNFTTKGNPKVFLAEQELTLISHSDSQILAELTADIQDGDYTLKVKTGPSTKDVASYVLTIKAVYYSTQLEIYSASIDLVQDTITLSGRNFENGDQPTLELATTALALVSYDDKALVASLPADIAELEGSYILTVSTGEKAKHRGDYTIVIDPEYSLDSRNGTIEDVIAIDVDGNVDIQNAAITVNASNGDVNIHNDDIKVTSSAVTFNLPANLTKGLETPTVKVSGTISGNKLGIGTLSPQAALHVKSTSQYQADSEQRGQYIALFENDSPNSSSGADGVAIKLAHDDPVSGKNKFVTFFDKNNNVAGEIRGFTADQDYTLPPSVNSLFKSPTELITGGLIKVDTGLKFKSVTSFPGFFIDLPSPVPNIDIDSFGISVPYDITPPSISICNILDKDDALACFFKGRVINDYLNWGYDNGLLDFAANSPFDIAVAGMKLAKHIERNGSGGISYATKGADYAEWLELEDTNVQLRWGTIVGVTGGRVSLRTEGADHLLVISRAPAVLGNMPSQDVQDNYVMVGFLGQLYTAVHGVVKVGDYILASGLNNGIGRAVNADNIELDDIEQIVGRAWTASDDSGVKMINVAVGLQSNDLAKIMHRRFDALEQKIDKISSRLNGR